MQTFLPLATSDYSEIAKVLDNKRLNKQALEGWQILMVLTKLNPEGLHREPKGWANHPAVNMWRGHEMQLYEYILAMVEEWKSRGFKSTIGDKAQRTVIIAAMKGRISQRSKVLPPWMMFNPYYEQLTSTHRQALLVKDYAWYSQFNWPEDTGVEPTDYEYIWPQERKQ